MPNLSPDFLKYSPIEPRFGSMTDVYGGTSKPEEEVFGPGSLHVQEETSVGLVDFKSVEAGINIFNFDLGVSAAYGHNGVIESVALDLSTFCSHIGQDDFEAIGGEHIVDALSMMEGMGDSYQVLFNFEEKLFAVLNINEVDNTQNLVSTIENADFSLNTAVKLRYGRSAIFLRFQLVEDEFAITVSGGKFEDGSLPNTRSSGLRILTDCNYQTFLDSDSNVKYDSLAKRVFLLR